MRLRSTFLGALTAVALTVAIGGGSASADQSPGGSTTSKTTVVLNGQPANAEMNREAIQLVNASIGSSSLRDVKVVVTTSAKTKTIVLTATDRNALGDKFNYKVTWTKQSTKKSTRLKVATVTATHKLRGTVMSTFDITAGPRPAWSDKQNYSLSKGYVSNHGKTITFKFGAKGVTKIKSKQTGMPHTTAILIYGATDHLGANKITEIGHGRTLSTLP